MKIEFQGPTLPAEGFVAVGIVAERQLTATAAALDQQLKGRLTRAMATSRFRGKRGATLSLLAINKTGSTVTATIHISGFGPLVGGELYEARAASLMAQTTTYNGSANPSDALSEAPLSFAASGNSVTRALAPYSVSLLHLRRVAQNVTPRVYLPILLRP